MDKWAWSKTAKETAAIQDYNLSISFVSQLVISNMRKKLHSIESEVFVYAMLHGVQLNVKQRVVKS